MKIIDKQIVAAIQVAGAHDREWSALTYETGPYDITVPNLFTRNFVDSILALSARDPIAPSDIPDEALEAFHAVKPLAGNEPCDWPEPYIQSVREALAAAFNAMNGPK